MFWFLFSKACISETIVMSSEPRLAQKAIYTCILPLPQLVLSEVDLIHLQISIQVKVSVISEKGDLTTNLNLLKSWC